MAVLEHLEPGRVFHFFEQMSAIPRGSGNTKAVSDWLAEFARERGLRYQQDALNNIIIFKDASAGYEGAEPVILQGHMDMVCEKAPDCGKDMTREGLDLAIDGDFVYAKGTTLAVTTASPWPWRWRCWTTRACPIPPLRRSSPWTRRRAWTGPWALTCPA
ncbi:MAG: hypothetical protein ACLR01_02295 [Vescimonas sp.]